jgi:RNA polymerase sigma-70 factor, ECF subfamily
VTVTQQSLAERFETERPRLLGIAYRLTSSMADAEDAVQEAWLRLSTVDERQIESLPAWLTTVVGRLCLDRLRSATARRERYVGPWLPEPVVTEVQGTGENPLDVVVREDGVRMAAMVVLDELTPEQRVAFVLHDAFAVPFDQIAATLNCEVATARQHASRGRRTVADADPPDRVPMPDQLAVIEQFVTAVTTGDLDLVVRLLHPDAVLVGDSDGKARTARRMVFGAEKIGRFFFGLAERYGANRLGGGRVVLINGDAGMLLGGSLGEDGRWDLNRRVTTFAIRDGKVVAIYDIVNPDKLTRVPE